MKKKEGLTEGNSTAAILDSIADGVFTVDLDWKITFLNRAAEDIVGVSRKEAIGKPCHEIFRADICQGSCLLRATMETEQPVINKAINILRADGCRIPVSISTAIIKNSTGMIVGGAETFRDLSVVEALRKEIAESYTFSDIVSRSHKMKSVFSILNEVAESNATLVITGESGTGKELAARAVHSLSARKNKPFIAVNCGALPDTLLESELFGHVAGAFTDAKRDRKGRFAQADGGTILLDEIGDISPALQVRFLRVLEEREYEPVGASNPVKADVRVICATNRDIEMLVKQNKFREDLYYRINVVRVHLPSLRERMEDVPLLAEHFVEKFNNLLGKDIAGLSEEALACLMKHTWPGNVRELENVIEHAFVLCRTGLIEPRCLPDYMAEKARRPILTGTTLAEIEKRTIIETLERNEGKKLATARELGINKTTLWRKLRKLGIAGAEHNDKL